MKANLGSQSSSQGEISRGLARTESSDMASETTRETRNSAVSNEFGPLPFSSSSQGHLNGDVLSHDGKDLTDKTIGEEVRRNEQQIQESKEPLPKQ